MIVAVVAASVGCVWLDGVILRLLMRYDNNYMACTTTATVQYSKSRGISRHFTFEGTCLERNQSATADDDLCNTKRNTQVEAKRNGSIYSFCRQV